MELQDDRIDRHKEVETIDDNEKDKDFREYVNIGVRYAENRQENLHTFSEFQKTWNQCLGRIDMVKRRIKLTTQDVRPINPACTALDRKQAKLGRQKSTKYSA